MKMDLAVRQSSQVDYLMTNFEEKYRKYYEECVLVFRKHGFNAWLGSATDSFSDLGFYVERSQNDDLTEVWDKCCELESYPYKKP